MIVPPVLEVHEASANVTGLIRTVEKYGLVFGELQKLCQKLGVHCNFDSDVEETFKKYCHSHAERHLRQERIAGFRNSLLSIDKRLSGKRGNEIKNMRIRVRSKRDLTLLKPTGRGFYDLFDRPVVFSRDKYEALAHRQGQQISQQTDLIDKVSHIFSVETACDMMCIAVGEKPEAGAEADARHGGALCQRAE